MDGLRTSSYPDGAIFAEEMLEWLSTANGGAREGQRRVVGVMVKDSQRYKLDGRLVSRMGPGNFEDRSAVTSIAHSAATGAGASTRSSIACLSASMPCPVALDISK
jgi:hypothetical protein